MARKINDLTKYKTEGKTGCCGSLFRCVGVASNGKYLLAYVEKIRKYFSFLASLQSIPQNPSPLIGSSISIQLAHRNIG